MQSPLFDHNHDAPSVFTPKSLLDAVVTVRGLPHARVPAVVVLEFDGDLYDRLLREGASLLPTWACFHTPMCIIDVDGAACGVIPRTIGGPFATLVLEQLFASGARVVVGLTSAGRVARAHTLPHFVVADSAIRDEGTSLHYIAASRTIAAPQSLAAALEREVSGLSLPTYRGLVWTTDAPYRETKEMLRAREEEGALAVEMQAASLFACAAARGGEVGVVAYVINAADAESEPFAKGPEDIERRLLDAICRAAIRHAGMLTV
ncbi:hypothetical protein BH09MYX1_BH09MYX1_41780 [soil metagenome]